MAAALNIAALSRRTGIAPDTLRKWEQRYGILRPTRTAGGQRRYSELDVARVEWLRDRIAEGYRIGEAAALLAASPEAARTAEELREALLRAVDDSDLDGILGLVDQAFALHAAETAFGAILRPVLQEVGAAWERGTVSVGQEHLVSSAVRARLERLLADARGSVHGVVVLACAPGERHELGLLMLGVMLRADGWQVAYLGADTPIEDALGLATQLNARALGISVSMPERARGLLPLKRPVETKLLLGGAGVTPELARRLGALDANDELPEIVRAVRALAA